MNCYVLRNFCTSASEVCHKKDILPQCSNIKEIVTLANAIALGSNAKHILDFFSGTIPVSFIFALVRASSF